MVRHRHHAVNIHFSLAEESMLTGACHCGHVRYEASGVPFQRTNCHCTICRGTSGAAFVSWFSVQREDFRFVSGTPTRYASSESAVRFFCPRCGTQLTFESRASPDEVDVTTASLDEPDSLSPQDETWVKRRLSWIRVDDALPQYEEARPQVPG
jgi:hypothetical protein